MASKNNINPHDTLVKEHFQNPENAISLIKTGLPAKILEELKLETLSMQGIHLSTSALLNSVTDLVFTCKLKPLCIFYLSISLNLIHFSAYPTTG